MAAEVAADVAATRQSTVCDANRRGRAGPRRTHGTRRRSAHPPAQPFFTRHARSNGSRQALGAISWWMALGPQLPGG